MIAADEASIDDIQMCSFSDESLNLLQSDLTTFDGLL